MKINKQIYIRTFRSIIGGGMATFGSFLIVSIEISTVATMLAFKGKGTLDDAILQPYIDKIIQYTSFPSLLFMMLIIALYLALKWNHTSKIEQLTLTLSTMVSVCWLAHHFGELNQLSIWGLIVQFFMIYVTGIIGTSLAPHYRNWKKNKQIKKENQLLTRYQLTQREKEIVLELLNGKSNKEIGNKLFIEEGTVKQHLKSIFKKIDVKRRSELISKFNVRNVGYNVSFTKRGGG